MSDPAFFVVREEGGEYEFLPVADWLKATHDVPIFGVRIGDQWHIADKILKRLGRLDGYRTHKEGQ